MRCRYVRYVRYTSVTGCLSQIPVFLVYIPVLINLGGYFDYSPGCIPVNGTHCGFTADRAQGRRAAPGFGSASAFRIVYRITAIFAHFAASRRQSGATEAPNYSFAASASEMKFFWDIPLLHAT